MVGATVTFALQLLIVAVIDASPIGYERIGVLAWNVGPPTPFWFPPTKDGAMMVFESARFCHSNDTYWPPSPGTNVLDPFSNQSYFRIRNMASGAVVGNIQGSEGYAYGSAVVDPITGTAWVFGSPLDLCHRTPLTNASNYVRAWWSNDLVGWTMSESAAIQPEQLEKYPFNTRVTPVVASESQLRQVGLPSGLNFVMVLENGRVAFHTGPSRNLTSGWQGINGSVITKTGGFGECPSVHFAEESGHFYVISGGSHIALARTKDFTTWDKSNTDLVTAIPLKDSKLSPLMGISEQASGKHDGADTTAAAMLRKIVANPFCWEFDVNDADFCCQQDSGAPKDKAFLLYSPSSQGGPPLSNCSKLKLHSMDFNGIATANVSLSTLLQSYF